MDYEVQRDYCVGGTIYASTAHMESKTRTTVHEYGHVLEHTLPGVHEAAKAYLEHCVGTESLEGLKAKFPGSKFDSTEKGRKDGWEDYFGEQHAYYTGKHYAHGSTEIVSMGLEALYNDPIGFAAKLPEFFRLIVGCLQGIFTVKP